MNPYIPAPSAHGEVPDDTHTAHVRHDDEVWTDSDQWVCNAPCFEVAELISASLRKGYNDGVKDAVKVYEDVEGGDAHVYAIDRMKELVKDV